MLDAGLPVLRSLPTSVSSLKGRLPAAIEQVTKDVTAGTPLADAIAAHPKSFSPIDIIVIEASELSGNLPEGFRMLSHWYSFFHRIRCKMISAMVLPVMLFHIAVMINFVPPLFLGRISLSQYFIAVTIRLIFLYIPTAAFFAVIHYTPKEGFFRRRLDALTLSIPVMGKAFKYLAITRYCFVFNMIFKAGVPIVESAKIASAHTGNAIVSDMFAGGAESAFAGNPVSKGFSPSLPIDFIERWQVGEETGELDNVLTRMTEKYTDITEDLFMLLAQWIPKIFYFLVCLYMIASIFRNFPMIR